MLTGTWLDRRARRIYPEACAAAAMLGSVSTVRDRFKIQGPKTAVTPKKEFHIWNLPSMQMEMSLEIYEKGGLILVKKNEDTI